MNAFEMRGNGSTGDGGRTDGKGLECPAYNTYIYIVAERVKF